MAVLVPSGPHIPGEIARLAPRAEAVIICPVKEDPSKPGLVAPCISSESTHASVHFRGRDGITTKVVDYRDAARINPLIRLARTFNPDLRIEFKSEAGDPSPI